MEPNDALAELLELSSQVEDVAILGTSGFVLACSGAPERGEQLARVAAELIEAAGDVREAGDVTRVEVSLEQGGVFIVCEGSRVAVATTVADATAGLVVYDLRTALRRLDDEAPTKRTKKSTDA